MLRRRRKPSINLNVRIAILAAIASLAAALISTLFFIRPAPSPSPTPIPQRLIVDVGDIIEEGDDAFRDYDYEYALYCYQRAENRTRDLIEFETESPSKDIGLLQHYHNVQTLVHVRIELTLTAEKISQLNVVLPDHQPDSTNIVVQ